MKFNIKDIYTGRIEELDKQLITCIRSKQWSEVKHLRNEKKDLLQKVKELEAKV